jgi:hypothetical protein
MALSLSALPQMRSLLAQQASGSQRAAAPPPPSGPLLQRPGGLLGLIGGVGGSLGALPPPRPGGGFLGSLLRSNPQGSTATTGFAAGGPVLRSLSAPTAIPTVPQAPGGFLGKLNRQPSLLPAGPVMGTGFLRSKLAKQTLPAP